MKIILSYMLIMVLLLNQQYYVERRYEPEMQSSGTEIEYEYDELNRVTKVIYPDGTVVTYQYDKNGNLIETIVSTTEETSAASTREEPDLTVYENYDDKTNGNREGADTASGIFDMIRRTAEGTDTENQNGMQTDGNTGTVSKEADNVSGLEKSGNFGWLIVTIVAVILAGGAVWMIRRRKRNEE